MTPLTEEVNVDMSVAAVPTIMVLSRFTIANDMVDEVRSAFVNRPHLVDGVAGFVRMEVMSPRDNPSEIWLVTYWTDEESYRTWHRSHTYRESHGGIPKGLKLVPRSTEIRFFDYICS
jgi:heme-degrading monooxygenase HmoA